MRDPDLIWRPQGKPYSLHVSPAALALLSAALGNPRASTAQRATETGGLLLGHARQLDEEFYVAVERLQPIEIEHARGESWTLSPRDRNDLARRVANIARNRREQLSVVGWYRTHTRPGLYLDQYDFDFFREHFGDESSIALIASAQDRKAGMFFWEEGDIRRSLPYETFDIPELATAANAVPASRSTERPRIAQWAFAIPIIAGIALGVFWNPAPLDRKPAQVTDLRRLPEGEASEDRPVYEPPPLPAPSVEPYVPPPETEPENTRAREVDASASKPKTVPLPPASRTLPEPQLSEAPPVIPASVRSNERPQPALQAPLVEAEVEQARPSGVRRVVGAIPGLGFLRKKKDSGERDNYVPARVVKQVEPRTPGAVAAPVTVRFRVTLNADGGLQRAELLTRNVDSVTAGRSFEALKHWRFEPAQRNNKPVSSELEVQFRFGPAGVAERRSDPGGG